MNFMSKKMFASCLDYRTQNSENLGSWRQTKDFTSFRNQKEKQTYCGGMKYSK